MWTFDPLDKHTCNVVSASEKESSAVELWNLMNTKSCGVFDQPVKESDDTLTWETILKVNLVQGLGDETIRALSKLYIKKTNRKVRASVSVLNPSKSNLKLDFTSETFTKCLTYCKEADKTNAGKKIEKRNPHRAEPKKKGKGKKRGPRKMFSEHGFMIQSSKPKKKKLEKPNNNKKTDMAAVRSPIVTRSTRSSRKKNEK